MEKLRWMRYEIYLEIYQKWEEKMTLYIFKRKIMQKC